MEVNDMIQKMYEVRDQYFTEHEISFIESMYMKVIYSRRKLEASEEATVRKMFKIYMTRMFKNH